MRKVLLLLLMVLFCNTVYAERFFKQHSTWYEKIPTNPTLDSNSANVVARMNFIRTSFNYNYRGWSKAVYFASVGDPLVTINIEPCTGGDTSRCDRINFHGWNLNVPMPSAANAPSQADGAVSIISADRRYVWDMRVFNRSLMQARQIKRHDLSGDGIMQPWPGNGTTTKIQHPFHGNVSVSPVPKMHGIVLYDEVASGYIDHAIYLEYGGTSGDQFLLPIPDSVYPCDTMKLNYGWADHVDAPKLGHRFQLDPALDVNNSAHWGGALSVGEKVIAKAMQEYGIIYIENSGAGNLSVVLQNLENDIRSWSDAAVNIFGAGSIPTNSLSLITPLQPPFTSLCREDSQYRGNTRFTIASLNLYTSIINLLGGNK